MSRTATKHDTGEPNIQKVPSLATALLDLHKQTTNIAEDMARVIGILSNIHTAQNKYDLLHRLKSIIGRDRSLQKMCRRWIALLQPLEEIADSIGGRNGDKVA